MEKMGRVKKGYWAVSGEGTHRIFDNAEHIRGFVRVHPETGLRTEIPLAENGELLMRFSVNVAGEVVFDVYGRREEDLFAVDLRPGRIFRIGALRFGWPVGQSR